MTFNKNVFYNFVRKSPFGGSISQNQVTGLENLLDVWFKDFSQYPDEFLAYDLATTFHETGGTMQPIREKGGPKYLSKYDTGKLADRLGNTPEADGDGQLYAGRGYVQLTGRSNYKKYGIEADPDRALDPAFAAFILYDGTIKGVFTGKKLSDYFNAAGNDPVNARRVINGTDKAQLIAGFYNAFLDSIKAAREPAKVPLEEKQPLPEAVPFYKDPATQTTLASAAMGGTGTLIAGLTNPWALLGLVVIVLATGAAVYFIHQNRKNTGV